MLHLEGREVGGCKLVRKIGEGGMGEVYLGEQIRVGNRAVAVKIVQAGDDDTDERIDDIAKRFQREAGLLGNFNHPNILPVHDSGVQGDLLYLVMQYAPDGSLADAIKGRTQYKLDLPASPAFVSDLIGQVASALQYTHDRGVVHRDVKPGNVLLQLEPNGHWHALLADFGIARGADASSQRTKVSGTLAYMAPEQFNGKFSPASDQYALAVMTYQLLTSHTPFEGDLATLTRGHMYDAPPSVRSYNAALPAAVDTVMARALAKDPAQRYPSVSEYAKALQAALAQKSATGVAAPPPPPVAAGRTSGGPAPQWPGAGAKPKGERPPRSGPGLGRVWLVLLAAVLLLVGIVGAGGYIFQQQQAQKSAQQTQTAQTASAATANAQADATAHADATQTAVAQITPNITPIPSPTGLPSGIGQDVTTPPPPPADVQATLVLSDPSPTCNGAASTWTKSSATDVSCPDGGGVTVTTTAPKTLGCISQQSLVQTDGYLTVIAQPPSGPSVNQPLDNSVVLAFRQGQGTAQDNGGFNVTGYYYAVDPNSNTYSFYTVDSGGVPHTITNGSLGGKLAQHFAISALYQGGQITMYINGVKVATVTDATYSSGWIGLCTAGQTTFSKAQVYKVGG
ncbi:MAG TPA: protein kinase [Ktedonobacterales bacterium]|nr:protein kinase [Ktedonobacterales bacterium]